MKQDVTLVLLAGGQSSRFWPLPHKMSIPILGTTFLKHQISFMKKVGFTKIILVVSDAIKEQFAQDGIIVVNQNGNGQGAAILSAKNYLLEKAILVVNADDIYHETLFETINNYIHLQKNLLVGYKVDSYQPLGYIVLNGSKIAKIHEKPGEGNEPSNYVKVVCDYFTNATDLLNALERTQTPRDSHYEEAISFMLKTGVPFEMLEYDDTWITVKYPWQTLQLMEYYLSTITTRKIDKTVKIHKSASIIGPVVIDQNARVMEYAKIVGPTYIGARVIVGNHTLIRTSNIEGNAVIGFGSDVTRSYIGNNSWVHTNYIGDSVIADNVGIGAGTVFSNLRLDEGDIYSSVKGERINTKRVKFGNCIGAGARIGVEVCLMPGVKIGQNSVVGPGVILSEDLQDNQRCYVKQSVTITDNKISNQRDRERFRNKL